MVLVSYIDILDYTGNDRQCLIHGEELFNEEKVQKVSVKHKATNDSYDVSAKCSHKETVNNSLNNDVSIEIVKGGITKLKSKCSCQAENCGKCEHVVATLIYLHRHNVDESLKNNDTIIPAKQPNLRQKKVDEEKDTLKRQLEQQQQRRLRHTRRSAVGKSNSNDCLELSSDTMRTESITSVGLEIKSEELVCDDSNTSDPNWDKENEDADEDDWGVSSDDDWEPAPAKRIWRGDGAYVKKESSGDLAKKRSSSSKTKTAVGQKVKDLVHKAEHAAVKETPELPPSPEPPEPADPPHCLLCEVVTDTRRLLRDHYLVAHDRDSVLVCERCGDYRLPRDHICPSQLEFRCRMCPAGPAGQLRTFKAGRDYWNHLIRSSRLHRHTQHRAYCGWPGCHERFQGELELLDHARLHLPDHVALMCPVCRLVLRNTDGKLAHMEKHDVALGVFECAACRAAFPDKPALRAHWEQHREERPHRCDSCGWRFGSEASLRAHTQRFHQGGPFCCAKCPQKFDDRTDVRIHFAAAHGKARCTACNFRCANQAALERHKTRAHGQHQDLQLAQQQDEQDRRLVEDGGVVQDAVEARCRHCGAGPLTAIALAEHLRAEHACGECGEAFEQPRELRTHRQRAHKHLDQPRGGGGSRIVCRDCDKGFKSLRDLEEHRRSHTGEKPFICAECGMTFKRAQNLEYHTKGAHKNERNFLCPECGKRFISNADMKRHLRYNHQGGKKWHLCPQCGHKLPSLYNLKLHVQSKHTGERPHKCSLCDQGFVASSDLKKHVLYKHRKEHPFGCDHCDKRYQRKRDLQLHVQRHHAGALFRCQECGKDFESYASMMQHSRYHTTEEPYQCAKCGRRFPHKMNLSRHLCTPNIKKNFRCHTCGLNFTTGGSLKSHRRRLHAGDTSQPPTEPVEEDHPQQPEPQEHQHQLQLQQQHQEHQQQQQLDQHQRSSPAMVSLEEQQQWRAVPDAPWAVVDPSSPPSEVILGVPGDEPPDYHELTAVSAAPHLLVPPPAAPAAAPCDVAPPLVFLKESAVPPSAAPPAQQQPTLLSLLIKAEDPQHHAVYHHDPQHPPPLQPLASSGAAPAPLQPQPQPQPQSQPPPLKLISAPPSQQQSPPGQSSLILGAPIQTTADGSFHLVFVPHVPAGQKH